MVPIIELKNFGLSQEECSMSNTRKALQKPRDFVGGFCNI